MPGNFFIIDRAAIEHHLVGNPKHFYPWVWLVSTACWKPTKYNINGKTVTLERGQLCASVRQMAEAWGWSKSAVDRFLGRLETETMIERKAGHGKLVISICNYSKYQDVPKDKRDTSGTASGTRAGHERDIKEQGNKETIPSNEGNARAKRSKCPDDFWPNPKPDSKTAKRMAGWSQEFLGEQVEKFIAWHQDKGTLSPDWEKRWTTWALNNFDERQGNGKTGGSLLGPAEQALANLQGRGYR